MRILKLSFLLAIAAFCLFAADSTSTFTYQIGDQFPPPDYLPLISTGSTQITGMTVRTAGEFWLTATLSSPSTPTTLTISVYPVGLSVGSYTGTVTVSGPRTTDYVVAVYLTVTPAPPPLTASTSFLSFNAVQGSNPPPTQALQVGNSLPPGTSLFSNTTPSPLPTWLNLPFIGVGTAPLNLQVAITPLFSTLAPGTYTATIKFYTIFPDRNVTVTISLNVTAPPPVLRTSVSKLQFTYMSGSSTMPSTQPIQVTSSGSQLPASVVTNASWLYASPLTGTTPFNIDVKVTPTGLAVGSYTGKVTVDSTLFSGSSSAQDIDVTLTVTADSRPAITSVVNGGSFTPKISPGTWITIMGRNFSPLPLQSTTTYLPTSMNGTSAQLIGIGGAYTLLLNYVSPTQINAFVPHEVTPLMYGSKGGAQVVVTTATGTASYDVVCEALAPSFFQVYGYVAGIIYPDNVIVGTTSGLRPVSSGSIVSLYGTGFGQTTPPVANVSGPMREPLPLASKYFVSVGGISAEVLWAGMVGVGLYQVNIKVPTMPAPGDYQVFLDVGSATTSAVMLPVR